MKGIVEEMVICRQKERGMMGLGHMHVLPRGLFSKGQIQEGEGRPFHFILRTRKSSIGSKNCYGSVKKLKENSLRFLTRRQVVLADIKFLPALRFHDSRVYLIVPKCK